MLLYQIFYYTWKNIKKSYNNDEVKILAQTWDKKFELPDRPYSVLDILDYFKYNIKNLKHLLTIL